MPKKIQKPVIGGKSVLARTDDGTIQLTFTIPFETVQRVREEVIRELAESVEVPGFRKGKAPVDLAMKNIDRQRLYEHTLQHLLPEYYRNAVREHNLRPVLQPRFELVSVEEEQDWTIRAITCELPEIDLGDYKKAVSGFKKDQPHEEKEQQIIKTLLEKAKIEIPKPLIDEEINHKLSQLLDQVQKLGITVEQYLASTGKTIEQVREDYAKQSAESIKLVLILNNIADREKVEVTEKEIDEVLKVSQNSQGNGQGKKEDTSPEHKSLIRAVLGRRKALDSLVNLA